MVIATLCLAFAPKDPKSVVLDALAHYQSLNSFSMTIEHNESSGLFPGVYTQSLKWKKGGHFELLVTKQPVFAAEDKHTVAPNYFADGKQVVFQYADGHRLEQPLKAGPNTIPGWEVSGGLILSFLQDTFMAHAFRGDTKDIALTFSTGTDKTWRGQPVREILGVVKAGGVTGEPIHFYLDAEKPKLLGLTYKSMPQKSDASMVFKDQEENPVLSESLGTVKN